jgi:hypothetical protein
LPKPDALQIEGDNVKRDQRGACRNAIDPENSPEGLLAAPRTQLGRKKRRSKLPKASQ